MENDCKIRKEKVARNAILHALLVLFIAVGLISICIRVDKANGVKSVYNYPNAVVVDKDTQRSKKLTLRVKSSENDYAIKIIKVPHGEYVEFNIGDTVKCH